MALQGLLWCMGALLALSVAAVPLSRHRAASALVYGITLAVAAIAMTVALGSLLVPAALGQALTLPLGLPWLGAHFRLDALAAFFLLVVNLGGAAASLFALGYGQPRARAAHACCRSSRPSSPA